MALNIHFYEVFDAEEDSLKSFMPSEWLCHYTSRTIQESELPLQNPEIISIRTQSVIPAAWESGLKAVLSRSAGFDHLTAYASRKNANAVTGHLYQYSGRAVAEHALMLMLSLMRRLPKQCASMPTFQRDGLTGRECLNRTLAVFGVGDIGHNICRLGHGLNMKVIGVDPVQSFADVTYVDKTEALARADVIACAMNLNETNRNYFTTDTFDMCRDGVVFINVARGEFARNTTLLNALQSKKLSAVGLDVYYDEPKVSTALRDASDIKDPEFQALKHLMQRDDVILTPHNAFNTREAVDRKSQQTVEQLKHYMEHGTFKSFPTPE